MSKLTCPYCFEQFFFSDIEYRCMGQTPSRCAYEPDHLLEKYQKLTAPPMRGRIFQSKISIGQKIRRSITGVMGRTPRCICQEDTSSVCPACHNDLPIGFGEVPTKTIALIGAKESGKSNFIAVLIHELFGDNIGGKFNSNILPWDDETPHRYQRDFKKHIYDEKVVVPGTITARAQMNYPLIYKFGLRRSGSLPFNRKSVSLMVFFDTAGEDLDKLDTMSTVAKYITNSDGIVILLDPLQMSAVRNLLPDSVPLPSEHTEPTNIMANTIRLFAKARGSKKIKTPIAVAFSKIDAIRGLFDPSSPIHYASEHDGFFDITDGEKVSENIRAHLEKWEGGNLDSIMQQHFSTYSYFGLSALGLSPESDGKLALGAAPFRVEDPFLWLLYKHGIVKGIRSAER